MAELEAQHVHGCGFVEFPEWWRLGRDDFGHRVLQWQFYNNCEVQRGLLFLGWRREAPRLVKRH